MQPGSKKVVRRRVKRLHLLTDHGLAFDLEAPLPPRLSLPQCRTALRLTDCCSLLFSMNTVCANDERSLLTNLTPGLFLVESDAADALQIDHSSSSCFPFHL